MTRKLLDEKAAYMAVCKKIENDPNIRDKVKDNCFILREYTNVKKWSELQCENSKRPLICFSETDQCHYLIIAHRDNTNLWAKFDGKKVVTVSPSIKALRLVKLRRTIESAQYRSKLDVELDSLVVMPPYDQPAAQIVFKIENDQFCVLSPLNRPSQDDTLRLLLNDFSKNEEMSKKKEVLDHYCQRLNVETGEFRWIGVVKS